MNFGQPIFNINFKVKTTQDIFAGLKLSLPLHLIVEDLEKINQALKFISDNFSGHNHVTSSGYIARGKCSRFKSFITAEIELDSVAIARFNLVRFKQYKESEVFVCHAHINESRVELSVRNIFYDGHGFYIEDIRHKDHRAKNLQAAIDHLTPHHVDSEGGLG